MRRVFLFAVLWAALFAPGHVLAACPMALADTHGAHAPCHSEGERGAGTGKGKGVSLGHDCCSLLAPSGSLPRIFAQKADAPADELAAGGAALHILAFSNPQQLVHPPPLINSPSYLGIAPSGGDTFLRTSRLRL